MNPLAVDGGSEDGASTADATRLGIVLVAVPARSRDDLAPWVHKAAAEIASDPAMEDALTLVGPIGLAGGRRLLGAAKPDPRRVRDGYSSALHARGVGANRSVVLGLVVVEANPASIARRIHELQSSPHTSLLPLYIAGLALEPDDSEPPANTVVLDRSLGPVRLDRILQHMAEEILVRAQNSAAGVIDPGLRELLFGAVEVPDADDFLALPEAAPSLEDEEARAHLARVYQERTEVPVEPQEPSANPSRRSTPTGDDRYVTTPDVPLRLTYLVAALTVESRSRLARKRLVQLLVELDRGLKPTTASFTSKTWLVAAGDGGRHPAKMRDTGSLSASDVWRPSVGFLDVSRTMSELNTLIDENVASYNRRRQPLRRPLVIFVMPSAALPGVVSQSLYRMIRDRADVAWVITDPGSGSPHVDIDPAVVAHDKDDIVNEVLHIAGYGPDLESVDPAAVEQGPLEELPPATGQQASRP